MNAAPVPGFLSALGLSFMVPQASGTSGASGATDARRYDPPEPAETAPTMAVMPNPPTLLVVDDEPELRGLLAEYFGRHGFAVSTAEDAAQARGRIAAARPDLAVLDINMPGENGLSLARWLREAHPSVAIVKIGRAHV